MKNMYKKVLALAMGLIFSVSAFAQVNFGTIEVSDGGKIFRGEAGVDYSKYAQESSVKTAGVIITNTQVNATSATFHFDMDEDGTYAYFTLYGVPGLVEYYVAQGYSEYTVFAALAQQGYVSAYMTDTTATVGGLAPGDTVTAYALALSAQTDTVGVLSFCNAVAEAGEATGTAEVALTISNIADYSFDIATEMNEHTAYFYFGYTTSDVFAGATDAEIVDALVAQVTAYSQDIAGTVNDLESATEYSVYIAPFNGAAELGTFVARNVTTGGVSIFNANGVNFNLYPNPATSVLNVEGEGVERVELYNAVGQQVMSENGAAQLNVNGLAKGAYILKVYSNGKVGTQKVIVK